MQSDRTELCRLMYIRASLILMTTEITHNAHTILLYYYIKQIPVEKNNTNSKQYITRNVYTRREKKHNNTKPDNNYLRLSVHIYIPI